MAQKVASLRSIREARRKLIGKSTVKQYWVQLSLRSFHLSPDNEEDQRVEVSIDWDDAPLPPLDFHEVVTIDIRSLQGAFKRVHVEVTNRRVPDSFHGFVESDEYVVIDSGTVALNKSQKPFYQPYPHVGRTCSGAIGLCLSVQSDTEVSPLIYSVYFFSCPLTVEVKLYFTVTRVSD